MIFAVASESYDLLIMGYDWEDGNGDEPTRAFRALKHFMGGP